MHHVHHVCMYVLIVYYSSRSQRGMTEEPQERLIIGDWGRKLGWCTSTFCGPGVVANGTLAGGDGTVDSSNKCTVALAATCSEVSIGATTASVIKCDACAGKHQEFLRRTGCTALEVQSWCTTPVLDFGAWGRTSNATILPLKSGKLLASFADGRPAISRHAIGSGHNVHFFWFPGMSHVNQAVSQYGRLTPFQPGMTPFIMVDDIIIRSSDCSCAWQISVFPDESFQSNVSPPFQPGSGR